MKVKDAASMTDILLCTLLNCQNKQDCAALLEDLCTYQEIEQMAQRAAAAQLLLEGKTYAEIVEETGISSATLSRVSRALRHGTGAYARLLPKAGPGQTAGAQR